MHFISHKSIYLRNQRYSHSFIVTRKNNTGNGRRTGGKERKLRVEQEKHVKAKERK